MMLCPKKIEVFFGNNHLGIINVILYKLSTINSETKLYIKFSRSHEYL